VRIDFLTLFPEMILQALGHSMMARASAAGAVQFHAVNPRDFCYDRHNKVDDTPYGGEPGMLIRPEPVALALESIGVNRNAGTAVILTAPTGHPFTQATAQEFAKMDRLALLCGHYEGFDHRVETQLCTHVVSIGDYVLTNGELPALVICDSVVRLLPDVLGSQASLAADSHADALLSAPNYTHPEVWRGEEVPEVLVSGNHVAIAKWRRKQALIQTRDLRPDLLAKARLEKSDLDVLSS
jgi:tRNA (guanine37-N1)-methyltransferase